MVRIDFSRNAYGFGMDWTLVVYNRRTNHEVKRFYLGQDAKVCRRIIGLGPVDVCRILDIDRNIDNIQSRRKIARLILRQLNLTEKQLLKLDTWAIAAE